MEIILGMVVASVVFYGGFLLGGKVVEREIESEKTEVAHLLTRDGRFFTNRVMPQGGRGDDD